MTTPKGPDMTDELRAIVEKLLTDDPNWIAAGISDEVIQAGVDAWDQANADMENYVSGETTDWDVGMVAAAIFKAMLRKALAEGDDA